MKVLMIFDRNLMGEIVGGNVHLVMHQDMHLKVDQEKGWVSRRVERCLAE